MLSDAVRRFKASLEIGYEQWHDGVGYDLEALDELTDSERHTIERLLIPRASQDWRDLEALDRLGTPAARQAILNVRKADDANIRLRALDYGPEASAQEWEDALVASLETAQLYDGLSQALARAAEHPSQAVVDILWRKIRDPESGVAYHCAATLSCIMGAIDSPYDDAWRPLFLRLVGPSSPDRSAAVRELEERLAGRGISPVDPPMVS